EKTESSNRRHLPRPAIALLPYHHGWIAFHSKQHRPTHVLSHYKISISFFQNSYSKIHTVRIR
ncbi:hypothetical protein, partial [Paraburkholderia caribensis]|uniref:hypothetical protein n=1 Tax=Paraburkholderia caribensis TaxID=75105 RepID=UPI001ABA4E6A